VTYSLGVDISKELVSGAPASEATARWFLVTPALDRALRDDPTFGLLLGTTPSGAQYVGISPSGTTVYAKTATGGGTSSGVGKRFIPAGAQLVPYAEVMARLADEQRASAPVTSSKLPLYIGLGVGGLVLAGGLAYLMTRKPVPMAANVARGARVRGEMKEYAWKCTHCGRTVHNHDPKRIGKSSRRCSSRTSGPCQFRRARARLNANSSFGPERDRVAAQARAAFARGDGAAARRALARLSEIDIALLPRAMGHNPSYAIPERHAYPITTALDAYHATQRLKQGRVKNETDAKRIISAIKHRHPGVWRQHLAGYPVSKIIASHRKGLAARHRS